MARKFPTFCGGFLIICERGPMESNERYDWPAQIRKIEGFADLYSDTSIPAAKAPRHRSMLNFKVAVEQFDDNDMQAIREYDRAKYGGFVNG
jgi:hypothetical protein